MSKFLDFLKDLGEGIVQEGGQEVADILSVRNLPDAALATLSAAKLATGVPLIIDHYTNNSLDRAETWVEDKLSNTLDRVPVLKTANWVAQKAALQPWETAQQDPSWGSFKNALDSTGNDFAGIVGYGVNAFKEAPSFIGNAAIDQAKAAYALSQAMITGQSPKEIGSKLLDFGEALFGPWLTLVSQPVIDVHSAFGEDAYQYLKTGEWNGSGLIPFNLPAEYAQLHPEMRDQMIAAYEQGYDSNQDGVADFTGGRAVWEFVIGHEHRFAKTFFEFANDPWTATLAIGLVEAGVKGLPKLAFFANSPAAKRILLNTAKAIGIINRTQQVTQDLPFVLAKYAGKGLGKAAFKVAPEASKTVSATAAGIRGAGKTIAANAINGPLNGLLGLTDQYIAQRESTAAASALDRIRDVGTNESLLIARHQPKNPIPDSYDPLNIHRRYYNPLPEDAGKYTVVGDRSTPLHIADPNGNIVSEFAGYNGPKKFRAAQDAADSLNRYLENTGIEFPSMGPPPKVRKPTPPPVGPLVDDPNAASIVDTTAETNPANVYVPDVVGDKATKTPAPLTGNDANPDWWEYQPRMTANGTLDPTDNRGLTQLVREWSQAKGNKKKQYETLFKRIGYDPVTNQPIPGGKLAQHEAKRRAIISKFYGAAEPGTSIEAAIELGGGFDRKVMNEYIASLQHAFFDLTPEYQKLFKTRDWPWDFSASGLPTPSGVIPLEQVTEEQVIDIGRRLYQQGWGASGLPGQTLGDRAAIIRGLINLAIYRNDEVGMAAMRVLGRHGWPDGQSGAFIVNYAFKHAPEPMLGYSGGQTAAVYRGKGVREAEPQMRDELSPMDWIGTMRRYYYGRDALRTIPVPSRVPGAAAATIAPAVGPAAPDNPLVARSNELLQATNNTKLTAEQVAPLTQLQQNLARATGGGEEMLDSYRFTTEPEPASPNALAQSEDGELTAPNLMDSYRDPAEIRDAVIGVIMRPENNANVFHSAKLDGIRESLFRAIVDGDKDKIEEILSMVDNLTPRERAQIKRNIDKIESNVDTTINSNRAIDNLNVGGEYESSVDLETLRSALPNLTSEEEKIALLNQPVPEWAIEADMEIARTKYPDMPDEEALAELRRNGLDDFSRKSELVAYKAKIRTGIKTKSRMIYVPGGIESGKFSYWDLAVLDAQGFSPSWFSLRDSAKLYVKLFRSFSRNVDNAGRELYDPLDIWQRLAFGISSAQTALFANMRTVALLRPTSEAELREMAEFYRSFDQSALPLKPDGKPIGAGRPITEQWFARKGEPFDIASVKGTVMWDHYLALFKLADSIVADMDAVRSGARKYSVFQQLPGEKAESAVNRISAIVSKAAPKTANFGLMLGAPASWPFGTMDVHMMRWIKNFINTNQTILMSPEYYDRIPSRFKVNGKLSIPLEDFKGEEVVSIIGPEGTPQKVSVQKMANAEGAPVTGSKKIDSRLKAIEEGVVEPSVAYGAEDMPLSSSSGNWTRMSESYTDYAELLRIAKDIMQKDIPELADMGVGGFQWFIWDRIRGSFEPHFMAFPYMHRLARMNPSDWHITSAVDKLRNDRFSTGDKMWYEDTLFSEKGMDGADTLVDGLPPADRVATNAQSALGGYARTSNPANVMRQVLQGKVTYDKGVIEFNDGGRAVIRLFEEADVSTVIHEMAHLTRRWFDEIDSEVANRFVGATSGDWTVEQEEKWARAFERFCRDDKYARSLDQQTRSMFNQLKSWMADIYRRIKRTSIDLEIDPATADFFSRLVSGKTRDEWTAAVPTGSPADDVAAAVPTTAAAPAPTAAAPAPAPTADAASAKKVRPSKSQPATANVDEATQLSMAFGADAAQPVPKEKKAKYVAATPAPAKPRAPRVKAPTVVASVGKRMAEDVELGNLDTWTPALFAAYHRLDAGETIDSLNTILQDAAREAGLIVETRGVGGKTTEIVSKTRMKSAKATIDLSDPFSYEQLANFANSKPVYANKKLYQTSRIRVLTQSSPPILNTGDVVIRAGQDIGDFVQEDVDIFLTKMPDTLPGEPEERIIDAYLNAIADGYTDRQAISMVSARIGKFYRMSAKEKAAFMSGKPMPKPGAIRRAVGKLGTVNQIGKQNQMYNITKIITRPMSDWIGNTVHFAISGNYAGVARQVKTANTALKILFMDPQEAKRVGMRVSDPLMKGLDTDLTAGLTNEFGGTVNKYGFAGHDLIMAEWAENSDLPWLAKIAAKAISNPRVQAASEAMDLLSRKNLGISIVNDEYVGALFRLREKLIADGLDPVDVMSRALEAARKRTGDPDVTAFSNRDIASVAGNDYGRWWGEQITIMRNRAKDEARRVLFVNSPQRNYEKSLGWAMYYFYWQSRSLNLAARSALQNPWVLSSYIKMWEGAQNEAERNGYPSTFVGMISYWGDPTNGLGWFGLSNPLGVLVPGFMMSEYYDATRSGDDDQPFYERLNTIIPASTIMTSAMAALGHTDQVPDLIGSRQVENLVMSVINWGNAHSIDFTNGRPVGSIVETVERQLMEGANAAARGLGLAEGQYNPYIPTTGQKDVIKSVVWQYAVEEYGDDIEQWTPEQWEEVSKAMTVIDEGIGESDFATKAYREWTTQLVKNRAINTVTPGGSVLRYGPRERARQLRDGSVPGTRPTNSGLAYEDVADLDRQRRQAGTQRDIVTATPDTRDILIQDQQADSASTPSQRAAADYYNLIVLRVPSDTEMYPDSMTFPTAIGAISAKTIRSMSEDERRNLANRFLDMTGMAFDQSMFYVNRDTAIASGKLPDLKAYDDYKQLIGQFETIADFRTWARDNNQYFAQLEENARKRYADTDNLSGQALEDRLDGWAKSTRAYQAFRGKQYSAYDDKPSNATDLGPSIPPTEGPLLRTQVIQNEAAGLNSNTAASTNLALMGAGYRPTGSSSEAMAYTNWLQNNNGTADEWWRQQQGVEQMPSYFDR